MEEMLKVLLSICVFIACCLCPPLFIVVAIVYWIFRR